MHFMLTLLISLLILHLCMYEHVLLLLQDEVRRMICVGGGGASVTVTVIDTTAQAAKVGTLLQRGHNVTDTTTAGTGTHTHLC
jgi:hypothetical protein